MGFGLLLIQQGWKLVELGQFQRTPVMGLSKRYVYLSVPAGGETSREPLMRGCLISILAS